MAQHLTEIEHWSAPDLPGPALCTQTDPELFFPDKGGSPETAKKVCRGCEVRAECLQWALDHGERWGVWGGLSWYERRKLGGATMGNIGEGQREIEIEPLIVPEQVPVEEPQPQPAEPEKVPA